ncbi:hypothetical protein H7Y21_01305 [Arenimonas sp.]|nr:hypothetical protein [Candidatus Parcubacteria bacterium]
MKWVRVTDTLFHYKVVVTIAKLRIGLGFGTFEPEGDSVLFKTNIVWYE